MSAPQARLRIHWDPTCDYCRGFEPTQVFPPHDASAFCESGGKTHCSCRACF